MSVTDAPAGDNKPSRNASGHIGWAQIDCLRAVMQEENLTVEQCGELARALREDAACLAHGSERDYLLQLAEGYRLLAEMKRMVLRKVN
jgi:hypothetical protein